jgi:hypothetical protein
MPHDFLVQPGDQRFIVAEVLDGQPDHRHPAALPLKVTIAIIGVTTVAAVMRAVDLQDQDPPAARD